MTRIDSVANDFISNYGTELGSDTVKLISGFVNHVMRNNVEDADNIILRTISKYVRVINWDVVAMEYVKSKEELPSLDTLLEFNIFLSFLKAA